MSTPWDTQLLDTATFYTISLTTSASGQQKKTETLLYSAIACNLIQTKQSVRQSRGEVEEFGNDWRCDVKSSYGGANRGDRVTVNSRDFIILKKITDTDFNGTVLFYKYYLKEAE